MFRCCLRLTASPMEPVFPVSRWLILWVNLESDARVLGLCSTNNLKAAILVPQSILESTSFHLL